MQGIKTQDTLTEANTLERARLELKRRTEGLDPDEKCRWSRLFNALPAQDNLSPGEKAVTSPEFVGLAAKVANASENVQVTLDEDVSLAQFKNGSEAKALITGLSDTSGGAFITNKADAYGPRRRDASGFSIW